MEKSVIKDILYIVMPAYNEEANIKDVIERIHDKYKLQIVRDFIDLYYEHDNMIKKLIKEYQIIWYN